jgi:hypothetical protein
MAIGRISGSVLKSNLTRNGVDLAFETNLLYLDVTNSRVGIGTSEPATALHVVGDTTITGTLNISGALTAGSFSPDSISVNNLSSADSTAIQINDAVNVSGTLTAKTFVTNELNSEDSTAIQVNDAMNVSGTLTANTFVTNQIKDANGNEILSFSTTASATDYLVVKNGIGVGTPLHIYAEGDSANIGVHLQPKGSGIFTISDGTDFNKGIRFRSSSSAASAITLIDAVSSAGRVITLPDATDTLVGRATQDTLTNKTISTANNTITGTVVTLVGDDSTGTAVNIGETFKIAGTSNITTAVSGDTLTITGSKDIDVNSITSSDSSAIQINDAVNVSGTLTANTIQTNSLSSTESTAIQVNDSLNASGTITAASFVTHGTSGNITGVNNIELNQISSNDSTAVQVADGMNVSGTLTAPTFVTNDISSGDSTAIQINDAVNVSGTLNAKIIVTNNISSEDSTAIQINDAVNVSGTLTVNSGFVANAITYPTADGSNGQVLQTDGAGNLTFADAGGGGGGNNTATRQFSHLRLTTSSAVIDEFDIEEYRAAVYHISTEDVTNSLTGMTTLSVVHDGSTAYSNQHESNEDSTNLALFSVAISGTKVQISAQANAQSSHVNLRLYRIALGDHHDTVANTNSKIIVTNTGIGSTAVTLDQFTKTDIQGAKYYILIKDTTAAQYQLSEMSVVHDGTTVYFNDYAKVLTNLNQETTFSADISGSTVNLKAISGGSTTGTAIMYRIDLGSATKLGEYDGMLYGKAGDVDSAAQTIDSFDALERRAAKYLITVANTETGTYQNSEITLVTDGTNAYITESVVLSGSNELTTFTADVSGGRARLRAAGSPANNEIYFARLSSIKPVIYRATNHTADNFYLDGANIQFHDTLFDLSGTTGAIILPSGSSAQQPTGQSGMLRYNTSLGRYEKWDGTSFVDILATTAAASDTSNVSLPTPITGIDNTISTIDSFLISAFDSAYYYAVTRDEINNETHTGRYTLVHNNSDAFVSHSNGVQSGNNDQISVTADINAGSVRLRATGTSVVNSVTLYRIGLGDSTNAGTAGNTATILNADVDSATENLDTWSTSSYRAAKYFISVNAEGITELSNLEALVVHDGSDAYITIYNEIYTGNNSLITLTADISGGTVRLRGSGNTPNLRVTMYRVLLSDAETTATGDNVKTVGASSVSSSATSIDTFSSDLYTGAQYIVVGHNSSESAASISEVHVVTDGSDAYVSSGPIVSTKGSDHLTFTAGITGSTVTLSAASTSGSSTTVNAFRIALLRISAGASTANTVLVNTTQTITGQKTFTTPIALTVGSDPSTVANTAHIYAKDESASAEVYVRDEAGNVTKISPHNAQGEWEYYSRNTKTGKIVRVNMEEMIRDLEQLTGKTYIKNE